MKTKLLEEINKEVKIEIEVSAYIPDSYISDLSQKILTYQMISNIKDTKDSMDVIDNLLDRFGELPKETENLIKVVEIRNVARSIGITKITQKSDYIVFEPSNLKFGLTNKNNGDILTFVQIALKQIQNMLIKEKKES
jgi:transcription-repair coupling factor (superfamily II helicase)